MPIGFRSPHSRKNSKVSTTVDLREWVASATGAEWPLMCRITPESPGSPPPATHHQSDKLNSADTLLIHGATSCRVLWLRPPVHRESESDSLAGRSCSICLADGSILFESVTSGSAGSRCGTRRSSDRPSPAVAWQGADVQGYHYEGRLHPTLRSLVHSQCGALGDSHSAVRTDKPAVRVRSEKLSASASNCEDFIVFPSTMLMPSEHLPNSKQNAPSTIQGWKLINMSGHVHLQPADVPLDDEHMKWKVCANAEYFTARQLHTHMYCTVGSPQEAAGGSERSNGDAPASDTPRKMFVRAVPARFPGLPHDCIKTLGLSTDTQATVPLLPLQASSSSTRPFLLASLRGECLLLGQDVRCPVQPIPNAADVTGQSPAGIFQQSASALARLLLSAAPDIYHSVPGLPVTICDEPLAQQMTRVRPPSPHRSAIWSSMDSASSVFGTPPGTPKSARSSSVVAGAPVSAHRVSDSTLSFTAAAARHSHNAILRSPSLPTAIAHPLGGSPEKINPYSSSRRYHSLDGEGDAPQPPRGDPSSSPGLRAVPEHASHEPPPLPERTVSPAHRKNSSPMSPPLGLAPNSRAADPHPPTSPASGSNHPPLLHGQSDASARHSGAPPPLPARRRDQQDRKRDGGSPPVVGRGQQDDQDPADAESAYVVPDGKGPTLLQPHANGALRNPGITTYLELQ